MSELEQSAADRELESAVATWLERLEAALAGGDRQLLGGLFVSDGEWRDLVALSWDVQTVLGEEIPQRLGEQGVRVGARDFRPDPNRIPVRQVMRGNRSVVEAFFGFATDHGSGTGVVRLAADELGDPRAQSLLTTLQELDEFKERRGAHRPRVAHESGFGEENWLDARTKSVEYADREPEVLVVGCGQAGLTVAARLRQLGVDTLVVDKMDRVGDNWRHRYHSLTLHNEVWVAHLPYMPFPDTWPKFVPKDMLAGWFESYAQAMELNIWTGTTFLGGGYDAEAGHWNVEVERQDGRRRQLRPRHVVMATGGVSGVPNIPRIEGLDGFDGEVLHSSAYRDGDQFLGRRVVIFGAGTSGHDIAQDLHSRGVAATLVQRSSITVLSLEPSGQLAFSVFSEGWATEDCDLLAAANTVPTLVRGHQVLTQVMLDADKELLDRLHAVGFRTDIGEDGTGFNLKYNRRGGGYYINVGCSELIADGRVGLLQAADIASVGPGGLRMADGSLHEADTIILATGYRNQQEEVRALFGDEVADRVGPVWGYGDDAELRNVYRRTQQDGLWFMAGSLAQCRSYSKYLALQIKAVDAGLATTPARLATSVSAGPTEGR